MKALRIFFSLVVLALFVAALGYGALKFWHIFRTLNDNVAAAIVTAVAGVIGLSFTQWQSKKREIAEGHRKNKVEVYELFLDIVDQFLSAEKNGTSVTDKNGNFTKKTEDQFRKLNRGIIVWSSPKVLKAWLKFRNLASGESNNVLLIVDDVLQAIRKDLGNSNFGLNRGDAVKIYLSDPEEVDKLK